MKTIIVTLFTLICSSSLAARIDCSNPVTGAKMSITNTINGAHYEMNQQLRAFIAAQRLQIRESNFGTVRWDKSSFLFRDFAGTVYLYSENGGMKLKVQIADPYNMPGSGVAHFFFNPGECRFSN